MGMMAWWMTWRLVSWLFFFFSTMKNESMKSVNLEKKYHHTMLAALRRGTLEYNILTRDTFAYLSPSTELV